MSLASVPTLVTAVLSIALGLFVLRRHKSSLHWTFALCCFLTGYWQICWSLLFNVSDEATATLLARLGYSGITFIPIVFFHFIVEFTQNAAMRKFLRLFYPLAACFLVLGWTGGLYIAGVYRYSWGFYPRAGELHWIFLALLAIMLVLGSRGLFAYRRAVSEQRLKVNQINYVIVSTIIYSVASIDFLANYGVGFYPLGMLFTNLHVAIIGYAIVQYRLLDINVAIKRSLISGLILAALLVPCYLILIASQQFAFGGVNLAFSLLTLALLAGAAFLFPRFRFMGEEALERALFQKSSDYRDALLKTSREMVSVVDIFELSERLVCATSRALDSGRAALYLYDSTKNKFNLMAVAGLDNPRHFSDPVLGRNDPLVQVLAETRACLVREEAAMARGDIGRAQAAERMRQLDAEVSVPILSKNRLAGILNLGRKDHSRIYCSDDLEFLSTLANQAAIAFDNARLYENLKQSQMTLRRADRLSSLGMLTAGLAHEIRNPLVAIRTFTQLLPERYDDPEFREVFQSLALKEVDRICGLINDLLSFARPSRPNIVEENLNEVVDDVARILESQAKDKDVSIAREFSSELPKAWIDREQLKQVFMNLILNAIQAMRNGGSIVIATRVSSNGDGSASQPCVQVEVRDTGMGIPQENLEHIFDPFFTNKDDGSGLGLSISNQIIEEHGGRILVKSRIKEGTSFFVNLPIEKPASLAVPDPLRAA